MVIFQHSHLKNEHIEADGYMTNISAAGVEQILDEKTSSYAEYEKEGSTLRQNMGYKSRVKLTKWLNSNVSFERSNVSGTTDLDSDASSVSLEAKPKDELTPEVTAFSKGSFSRSKDEDTTTVTRRDKQGVIGLAYRPIACDRLNVIGKYEYKRKENIQIASQETQTTNHVASVEAAIDVLTEGKYIYLHETGDWKLGSSVEVGYRPIKDLRLGVGYTFTEYDDGTVGSDKDYLSRGPYVKVTVTPSF